MAKDQKPRVFWMFLFSIVNFLSFVLPVLSYSTKLTKTKCTDGLGLNYTLPMFIECKMKRHPNGSMVQTIPKLIPLSSVVAGCKQRKSQQDIPPGHRVCRFPDCDRNLCKNGWCEETMVDYMCHCSVGFQGKHCDEESKKSTATEAMTVPKTSPTTVMSVQLETTTSEETSQSKSTESLTTEATTAPKTSPTDTISEQSETTTSEETTTSACTSPPLTDQRKGSYYNFSICKVDHVTAVSACSQYGSHLVFIGSKDEQDFIMQQIEDSSETYWIGLTRNSDMEVTWLDGSRLTYDNTARVSPFDDGGKCIRIDGRSSIPLFQGTWHDKPCDNKLRYICEKESD